MWFRTCQSCGNVQTMKEPNRNDPKERWREAKCRKCGSEDLDFGSARDPRLPVKDD